MRALLAQLDPLPAHVATARYDVLAWNRAYAAVMGDIGALPCDRRNTLWLLFLEPRWRRMLLDWPRDVGHLVAQFRANMAAHVGEPAWTTLVAELEERSPEFRELWARHEIGGPTAKRKRYLHPVAGLLELESTSLWLADQPGARLVVGVPVDEAAREALERLADAPAWVPWCSAAVGAVAAD